MRFNPEFSNPTEVQAHQPRPPEIPEGSVELQESWQEKFGRAKDSVVNLFNGLGEKFRKSPEAQAETSQEGVVTLGEILEQNPQQMAQLQKTVSKRDWKKITGQVVTGVGVAGAVAFGAPVIMAGTGVVGLTAGTYAAASIGVGTYTSVGLATMGGAAPVIASASAAASLGLARLGRLMQGNPYSKEKRKAREKERNLERDELNLEIFNACQVFLREKGVDPQLQDTILSYLPSRINALSQEKIERIWNKGQVDELLLHDFVRGVLKEYFDARATEESANEAPAVPKTAPAEPDTQPDEIDVDWEAILDPAEQNEKDSTEEPAEDLLTQNPWGEETADPNPLVEAEEYDPEKDFWGEEKEISESSGTPEDNLESSTSEILSSEENSSEEEITERELNKAVEKAKELFQAKGLAPEDEARAVAYLKDKLSQDHRSWYSNQDFLELRVSGVMQKLQTDFNFDPAQLERQRNDQEYGRLMKTIDTKPDYFVKDVPGIDALESNLRQEIRDTVNDKLRQLDPQNSTDIELILSQSGGQLLEGKVQQWYNRQVQEYLNTLPQEPVEEQNLNTKASEETPDNSETLSVTEQAVLDLQTKDYKQVEGKKQMFKIRQDLSKALRPQIEKYDLPLTVNNIRLKESYNSFFNRLSKYSGEARKDYLAKGVGGMFYEGMRSLPQAKRAEIINTLIAENKEKDPRFANDYLSNPEIKRFVTSPARELMNTSTTLDMALGALLTQHYLELPTTEDLTDKDNQPNDEKLKPNEENPGEKTNNPVETKKSTPNQEVPGASPAISPEVQAQHAAENQYDRARRESRMQEAQELARWALENKNPEHTLERGEMKLRAKDIFKDGETQVIRLVVEGKAFDLLFYKDNGQNIIDARTLLEYMPSGAEEGVGLISVPGDETILVGNRRIEIASPGATVILAQT